MATAENAEAAKKPYCIALALTMLGTALLGVAIAMGVVGGLFVGLVALAAMCFAWSAILWMTANHI